MCRAERRTSKSYQREASPIEFVKRHPGSGRHSAQLEDLFTTPGQEPRQTRPFGKEPAGMTRTFEDLLDEAAYSRPCSCPEEGPRPESRNWDQN